MSPYRALAERFAGASREILGGDLVGVYLHGSLAMGCFNAKASDIDLIVVTGRDPDAEGKRRLMDMALELDAAGPAKGLEFSVVCRDACDPFQYPTPFALHYSRMHKAWYQDDPAGYIERMNGTDADLAAHFTILRHRGVALLGEPIDAVFGEVPRSAYLDSIFRDVEGARQDITGDPVYVALNLCRVLAFASEGAVLSKREGGEWGTERLPEPYSQLARDALAAYNTGCALAVNGDSAAAFAEYMLDEIKKRV